MDIMNEIITDGNTDYNRFLEELIKNGMDKKWARMFVKKFCPDGNYICYEHPDTHAVWKDCKLPNWDKCKKLIEKTCNHIGSLDYLGMDIIITENGMKFCEINTHPAADYEQIMCGPILADAKAREFFKAHGLFDVNTEAFYDAYVKSLKN